MNLTKTANSTYSYQDATVTSTYNKEAKTFSFEIVREGFETLTVEEKNILVLSNKITNLYSSMKEVQIVESNVDIDADLNEEELALADFIRKYNPEAEETVIVKNLPESQDEVLASIKNYLTSESEDDYVLFREALAEEEKEEKVENI